MKVLLSLLFINASLVSASANSLGIFDNEDLSGIQVEDNDPDCMVDHPWILRRRFNEGLSIENVLWNFEEVNDEINVEINFKLGPLEITRYGRMFSKYFDFPTIYNYIESSTEIGLNAALPRELRLLDCQDDNMVLVIINDLINRSRVEVLIFSEYNNTSLTPAESYLSSNEFFDGMEFQEIDNPDLSSES